MPNAESSLKNKRQGGGYSRRRGLGKASTSGAAGRVKKEYAPSSRARKPDSSSVSFSNSQPVTATEIVAAAAAPRVAVVQGENGQGTLTLDEYKVSFVAAKSGRGAGRWGALARSMSGGGGGGFQSAKSMLRGAAAAPAGRQKRVKLEEPEPAAAKKQPKHVSDATTAPSRIRLDETQSHISKIDINQPLLIVAGAGSGKTSTLCARVLEIIKQGVAPSSILVITFTNKAAAELRDRIQKYMEISGLGAMGNGGSNSVECGQGDAPLLTRKSLPYSSTFHSWCYHLMLRYFTALGLQKCPMICATEAENKLILKLACKELEDCRMLIQSEKMLKIPPPSASGEKWQSESIFISDSESRWSEVVRLTQEKTGFTVDGVDLKGASEESAAKSIKPRKHKQEADAMQSVHVSHTAVYLHLYLKYGAKHGLVNVSANPLDYSATFPGKKMEASILNFIHTAKARGDKPEMFPQLERSTLEAYNSTLHKFDLVDFDDLLETASKILDIPVVLGRVRSEFPYLLVDEFQDLNNLQMKIVLQLQKGVGRVTAVGDERQSIYAFRGASCENNFKTFLENFVDASVDRSGGTMESLTRNYRSHQSIVDLGNIVARDTIDGSELLRRLRVPLTALPTAPVVPITVWQSADYEEEASNIADKIKELVDSGDCKKSDIAVLSRCLQFGSYRPTEAIERALLRNGIPYIVRGGTSALRTKKIQLLLALLRLLINRDDDIAMRLCMEELVHGLGPASMDKIENLNGPSLFSKVQRVGSVARIPKQGRDSLRVFVGAIEEWGSKIGSVDLKTLVCEIYATFVSDVALDTDTSATSKARAKSQPMSDKGKPGDEEVGDKVWEVILAMIDSFIEAPVVPPPRRDDEGGEEDEGNGVDSFDPEEIADPTGPCTLSMLRAFSGHAAMLSGSSEDKGELTAPKRKGKKANGAKDGDAAPDAVMITTVHQAKGLEWEHVYIPHFNESLFPMGFRGVSHADHAKNTSKRQERATNASLYQMQHFREEGRLAYVAITRAKRGLYISALKAYPKEWMESMFGICRPSRYLPGLMCPAENA
ncbi:P-loop containing nucleoside triphosphate hydrolase protein [Martensiomyces pterosporus]|nr:P-loop containing nucleoside triphosphate hydrolase protein [Martensiomyces pterosporus]